MLPFGRWNIQQINTNSVALPGRKQPYHSLSCWMIAIIIIQPISCRADSRLAPSLWQTSLQSNAVSHWLGTNLESALSWLLLCAELQWYAHIKSLCVHITLAKVHHCQSSCKTLTSVVDLKMVIAVTVQSHGIELQSDDSILVLGLQDPAFSAIPIENKPRNTF